MVTTEAPVFSTALFIKDLFESLLISLNFELTKGGEMTLIEQRTPIVNVEESKNFL